MAERTDQEKAATDIQNAVNALNRAWQRAKTVGVKVELDDDELKRCKFPLRRPNCSVQLTP